MSDIQPFTCDVCGAEFPPDPACMTTAFWSGGHEAPEGEAWKHADHRPELSPEDRERAKVDMNITDEQLDRLLAGEVIEVGVCICKPCQDEQLAEAERITP